MPQQWLRERRIIEAGEFGRKRASRVRTSRSFPALSALDTLYALNLHALNIDRVSSIKAGRSLYARSAPIGTLQGGDAANPGRLLGRHTIASPRFFSQTRNRTSPRACGCLPRRALGAPS